MNKILLIILCGILASAIFIVPSRAEALSIKIQPSLVLGQYFTRVEERPVRIVHRHQEIYHYQDPYTLQEYYYQTPVRREYVETRRVYPQRVTSTSFNLGFKFR